jgi:trk system potassium uptake protein TrkH
MKNLTTTLHYLGIVLIAFAFLQGVPLIISAIYAETVMFPMRIYALPAAASAAIGVTLVVFCKTRPLTGGIAMAIGALGWFTLSLIGAVPYWLALKITYLDAFFESVSGFTTTGATLFAGLDGLPRSILFWRGLTQWIGGLGIFTLFLLVALRSGLPHNLYLAESHKMSSKRLSPGLFSSLRILWAIYGVLTLLCGSILWAEGLSPFDSAVHALTTISTGGFSTHDASIGFFQQAGYAHAVAIEYTLILFMFLGGTSFVVHWNLLQRRWKGLRGNMELRLWIFLLATATLLVAAKGGANLRTYGLHTHVRTSLFHVVSLATTTGFTTRDIAGTWFGPLARQVFLFLMLMGGCVGSTAGGVKVLRVGVLGKLVWHQLRLITRPSRSVVPFVVNGEIISAAEVQRTMAIFFAWLGIILLGGVLTGLLTQFGSLEALSGAMSALGNVGPSYISTHAFTEVGEGVKVLYILLMVAGRLEILPLLLIFSRRVWR